MAKTQTPFTDAPASKTHTDPVDWRWVEEPPARGSDLLPGRPAPRGYDEIPADTFRCGSSAPGADGTGW